MCGKWNGVLHFLVGSTESGFDEPAEEVQRFLMDTGLMGDPKDMEDKFGRGDEDDEEEEDEDDEEDGNGKKRMRITNNGVDFLLKDVHVQVRSSLLGRSSPFVITLSLMSPPPPTYIHRSGGL